MNLNNVKYPWVVLKYKESGLEAVLSPNFHEIKARQLVSLPQFLHKELQKSHINVRNRQEVPPTQPTEV